MAMNRKITMSSMIIPRGYNMGLLLLGSVRFQKPRPPSGDDYAISAKGLQLQSDFSIQERVRSSTKALSLSRLFGHP
jgi:hypothetical protein